MKYKAIPVLAAGLLALTLAGCGTGTTAAQTGAAATPETSPAAQATPAAQSTPAAQATPAGQSAAITEDDAKNAALAHAGLTADQVSFARAHQDWDDGRLVYDVEFYTADYQEYDYEIDASTGDVLSFDYDAEHYDRPDASAGGSSAAITADQAKEIALEHAGLTADQVSFARAHQDRDDGRLVYDVEFYTADYQEYDYEIDASTGDVLSFDYDAEHYDRPDASAGGSSAAITADQAREIALAEVPGASASDIWEFETDRDDGRLEYDCKIVYDGMEYEFSIDGSSGAIMGWESEPIRR